MTSRVIREDARRPMLTVEELQRTTAQVEETFNNTIVSYSIHSINLPVYGRAQDGSEHIYV